MKRNKSSTRRSFKESQGKAIPDTPKRVSWQQQNGINRFTLTESQDALRRKILNNDLTFCVGPAGTGKSLSVLYTYVQEYLKDSTKQIIFIRTPVEAGMDRIGFLPDGAEQKLEPHFASAKALLEQLLSKGKVETDLSHRIHFKIPNFALGATFDNALICIDEAQQLPPLILKLLLERTGINSKVVVLGDNTQLYVDSKGRNALLDAVPRFFSQGPYGWESKFDSIVYHEFEVEDVMRSELVKSVIRAYS